MNTQKLKLEEVFKKSGVPTYTFVKPTEFARLVVALRTPGRGVVVEGPSGIGKTSAVSKALNELGLSERAMVLSGRRKDDVSIISSLAADNKHGLVVVDDFHRLPDMVKHSLADHIKVLADEESETEKIVIIGINRAGDSLLRFAEDISGRIERIKFEHTPEDRIRELIERGEQALNCIIINKAEIINEVQGSFNIAQTLCHEACMSAGLLESSDTSVEIKATVDLIRERVLDELALKFFPTARDFATGPKLYRAGRAPYLHILNWLSQAEDWCINFDNVLSLHAEHKASVGQVISKGLLQKFLNDNPKLGELIHYDSVSTVISIEDPKFVYFLRHVAWKRFAEQVGYLTTHFESKYDIALSFAGSDRSIAEELFKELEKREFAVFYDKNEQHLILGQDVEEYLAPIYKSEAQFIIVLLGRDYSKRLWTKFESQQFKQRFGKNAVIPVWFDDVSPTIFDETVRYGGLTIERGKPLTPQVQSFCEDITKRFSAIRRS